MTPPAQFFAVQALRATWRQLRKELRQAEIRDVVDWLDWAKGLDQSLKELHGDLCSGSYHPLQPSRFESPKGAGSFRVVTAPHVRDALVYRHIADTVLNRSIKGKVRGAFFSRSHAATPIGKTFSIEDDPSLTALEIWLRYNEYRSLTLLNQPYRLLVLTDITNYFDSISHDLLLEHFAPTGLPREAAGILGKLLEALRPTAGHSSAPRLGLAVDEFDCSRQLAHVFLFAHDRRVADEFGEDNYVRWMDDHNVGVDDRASARRVVNFLTRSLAQQRLTLNSGKTRFLTPSEVAVHFQLEANKKLNEWHDRFTAAKRRATPALIADFRDTWSAIEASPEAGHGNWDKVLKRASGMAAELNVDDLEYRALPDLIEFPYLATRIFIYFARRNRGNQLLRLFNSYLAGNDNLHEFVESRFFESCLFLSPSTPVRNAIRILAASVARGRHPKQTGRPLARASAILCLYWAARQHWLVLPQAPALARPWPLLRRQVLARLGALLALLSPSHPTAHKRRRAAVRQASIFLARGRRSSADSYTCSLGAQANKRLLLAGAHVLKELVFVRLARCVLRACSRLANRRVARSRNAVR